MARHSVQARTLIAVAALMCLSARGHSLAARQGLERPAEHAAPSAPRAAKALVNEAVATAGAAHKNVLVDFGASWCGWCHRFDAFIADSVAGKLMRDNFVVVPLIALESVGKKQLENDGAEALMKQMGGTGGIPFFFFLDSAGRKIGDSNIMPQNGNVGHPNTPEEVDAFDVLLKRVAPRMTAADRRVIWDFLTRMAGRTVAPR
jgi:thiol:disulfide interchange protein